MPDPAEVPWDKAWQKKSLEARKEVYCSVSGRHFPAECAASRVTANFSREEIEERFLSQQKEEYPLSNLVHSCLNQIPFESCEDYVCTVEITRVSKVSRF